MKLLMITLIYFDYILFTYTATSTLIQNIKIKACFQR